MGQELQGSCQLHAAQLDRPARLSMDRALVTHGADVVPFGIEEAHQFADRWNHCFRHDDFSAMCRHTCGNDIDILDRKCRLDAVESGSGARHQAFVHETANPGRFLVAGMYQIKARRSPGLELPFEYRFIESAGAVYIIDMDGERGEIVWHGMTVLRFAYCRNPAILTFHVAKTSISCGRGSLGGAHFGR